MLFCMLTAGYTTITYFLTTMMSGLATAASLTGTLAQATVQTAQAAWRPGSMGRRSYSTTPYIQAQYAETPRTMGGRVTHKACQTLITLASAYGRDTLQAMPLYKPGLLVNIQYLGNSSVLTATKLLHSGELV
jgi:hypothetical protein